MTTTQIWKELNQITPKECVYGLAYLMANLDEQTCKDFIEKYRKDLTLTEKEIKDEISKQKLRRIYNT